MLEKLRWKLKFPPWAVILLINYLGCHLMIKICLFSLLKSFSSLCCFSATQTANGLRSIKLTVSRFANIKTSISNVRNNSFCSSCIMPLHRCSFLNSDCNEDHQATLLEKGTYSLALFTELKQNCNFVNTLLMVFVKILGILFYLHIKTNQQVQSMLKT